MPFLASYGASTGLSPSIRILPDGINAMGVVSDCNSSDEVSIDYLKMFSTVSKPFESDLKCRYSGIPGRADTLLKREELLTDDPFKTFSGHARLICLAKISLLQKKYSRSRLQNASRHLSPSGRTFPDALNAMSLAAAKLQGTQARIRFGAQGAQATPK